MNSARGLKTKFQTWWYQLQIIIIMTRVSRKRCSALERHIGIKTHYTASENAVHGTAAAVN